MDPSLFRLDWSQVTEVLAAVVVLSFIVERALAPVFESKLFVDRAASRGFKEPIAFGVALFVCWRWQIDVVSVVLHGDRVEGAGIVITAAVIAGGSKASLKLFRDVLGIESEHARQKRTRALPPSPAPERVVRPASSG
jgi:hypothetical protein